MPGLVEDIDWFNDDAWTLILDKWRSVVTIAKMGGLKGIFFDTKQYSGDHNKPLMVC